MTLIEAVNSYLNSRYLVSGNKLPEESSCKEVEVLGRIQILNIDDSHFKTNVLNNIFNAGACRKLSDYIIISNNVILISELKSNNVSGANKQLLNSKLFFDYIFEILNKNASIVGDRPVVKFVTFSNKGERPTTKPTVKLKPLIVWNDCEKFHLKCGTTYHISQFI